MKAYESVRHFLPKVPLTVDESIEIHKGIKKLGRRLERLREHIGR